MQLGSGAMNIHVTYHATFHQAPGIYYDAKYDLKQNAFKLADMIFGHLSRHKWHDTETANITSNLTRLVLTQTFIKYMVNPRMEVTACIDSHRRL